MSSKMVPVTCNACGAPSMGFSQTIDASGVRTSRLYCACGEVAAVEVERRETIRAIYGGRVVTLGKIWVPVQ